MLRSVRYLLAALAVLGIVGALSAQEQPPRQVYAYYMGWWTGEAWGNPILTDQPGEPYDSRDAGALGRHIDQARGAGIDAFIISWFGPANDNLTNSTFNALLDQASARDFRIGVSVDMFQQDYLSSTDTVVQSLSHIINDRANHPAYLRYDGKPVIYFWNQSRFSLSQWRDIRAQVDPSRSTIWVMEGTSTSYLEVFDGLYLFNVSWGSPETVNTTWAGRARRAGATFFTPTVMPGWDEDAIAARDNRPNPSGQVDRSGGDFLTRSWNGAAASGANAILIVSWNEYFENSHIEPSRSFGRTALDTLQPLIQGWKAGSSAAPAQASQVSAGQPGAASGVTFTAGYALNMRAAPTTDAAIVASIPYNAVLDVVARSADASWLLVNYGGGSGWVAAYLGTLSADLNTLPVQ